MAPLAKKARTTPQGSSISSFFGPKKTTPATPAAPAAAAAPVAPEAPQAAATPAAPEASPPQDKKLETPEPKAAGRAGAVDANTPTKDEPSQKASPPAPAPEKQTPEKPSPPVARRVATACSGRFQSGFTRGSASNWQQYNNLYRLRLNQLGGACREEAKKQWSATPATGFLQDLSEFRNGSSAEIVVTGIVFKELRGRPNVIDEYKGSKALLNNSKEQVQILYSDKDTLWVEDAVMRIQLEVADDLMFGLATGFVVAVRGTATQAGTLKVTGVQFPRMPVVPPLPSSGEKSGQFVALVSGLGFGADEKMAEARSRAIDFLCGKTQALGQAVQHVVVCGGSFAKDCQLDGEAKAVAAALRQMDEEMFRLVEAKPVQVMPSHGEPTNASLPQLPFHRSLFRQLPSSSGFRPVGNPCSLNFDGLEVLGHSGEPVKDLLRCARLEPIHALQKCLEARHLAPTAPDTLMTQPFEDSDPFVLESVPHILFSGGHAQAVHTWRPCAAGGTQCICVPDFHLHPAVVLVNLRDPRDVRIEEFGLVQ